MRMPVFGNRFGVEIEAEGALLPPIPDSKWAIINDGSLRGNSCEYVLSEPCYGTVVRENIEKMIHTWKNSGQVSPSDRCGIHVHCNVQNLRINNLYSMLALYFIVESIIIEKFAPERKGNLFCMSGEDAEGVVDILVDYCRNFPENIILGLDTSTFKYAALNLASLNVFGTLEYRALSTPRDPDKLRDVVLIVRILSKMKQIARDYGHPSQIIEEFSRLGPILFFQLHYPDLDVDYPDLEDRLYSGVRLVQEIAYAFPTRKPTDAN